MKRARFQIWVFSVFALSGGTDGALAQDTPAISRIEIATRVADTQVPLNRTIDLTVTLSWLGEADRYTVNGFDNPALSNFDILGTATVNRSEVSASGTTFYKDYVYTLRPRELGMAYVEGVVINCRDNLLAKDESLVSQRIPVEVIDPVADPIDTGPWWAYVVILAILGGAVWAFLSWRQRKNKLDADADLIVEKPTGQVYLDRLGHEIQLETPNLGDDFTTISRLLRGFLVESFRDHRLDGTTDEVIDQLRQSDLEEHHVASVDEILRRCDEIKFSGVDGSRDELTRFYTLFEGILQYSLRQPDEIASADDPEGKQ